MLCPTRVGGNYDPWHCPNEEHGERERWGFIFSSASQSPLLALSYHEPGWHFPLEWASPAETSFPFQEQKILLSIYNMSMSLWAAASGSLHDSRELAAMKVASNTESVIRQHCRKIHKVGASSISFAIRTGRGSALGWGWQPLLL